MSFYGHFNLHMDRSPGFGSTAYDFRPIKTRFHLQMCNEVMEMEAGDIGTTVKLKDVRRDKFMAPIPLAAKTDKKWMNEYIQWE